MRTDEATRMDEQALEALRLAVREIYAKARHEGRKVAVWRDGKAVLIDPPDGFSPPASVRNYTILEKLPD